MLSFRSCLTIRLVCFRSSEAKTNCSFQESGPGYPTILRPNELLQWINRDRPWEHIEIGKPSEFGVRWCAWWESLQPDERSNMATEVLLEPNMDMNWWTVQKPGKNGLLLAMVSLVWWGWAGRQSKKWKLAVRDVGAVIGCMIDSRRSKLQPLSILSKVDEKENGNKPRSSKRGKDTEQGEDNNTVAGRLRKRPRTST